MKPGSGALRVVLTLRDGRLRAAVDAPAPAPFGALARGKPAAEAAALAPLLFNICAAAQEGAARRAFGLPLHPGAVERLRIETLREHGLKLCLGIPSLLGVEPDAQGVSIIARGGVEARRTLFGAEGAPRSFADLTVWALRGRSAAARAMAVLLDWPADWAAGALVPLDPAAPVDWAQAGQNGAVENSPLLRTAHHPLMRALLEARGVGPAARLLSRLLEAEALLTGAPEAPWRAVCGHAVSDAARGVMLMRATLDGAGNVVSADRLTPTDFALAPGGALDAALATLPVGPGLPTERVAQTALALIDPCMPASVEMRHA